MQTGSSITEQEVCVPKKIAEWNCILHFKKTQIKLHTSFIYHTPLLSKKYR